MRWSPEIARKWLLANRSLIFLGRISSPVSVASPLDISNSYKVQNGIQYQVQLRAVNAAGAGAPSESVTVIPRGVPGAPTELTVVSGNGQVSVNFWQGVDGGSPILNYEYTTDKRVSWMTRLPASGIKPLLTKDCPTELVT